MMSSVSPIKPLPSDDIQTRTVQGEFLVDKIGLYRGRVTMRQVPLRVNVHKRDGQRYKSEQRRIDPIVIDVFL